MEEAAKAAISIEDLINSKAHFGHITTKRHPKMKEFLYSKNNRSHIIDPRKTLEKLKEACDYAFDLGKTGKRILYVGSKTSAAEVIKENALKSDNFYINFRWLGGTLTNFQTIRQSMTKLNHIENMAKDDLSYPDIIKKEAVKLEKSRKKLLRVLGGFRGMKKPPGALFVVDTNREKIAIKEARVLGLPIVAIADSDVNPELIDYVIPCNDDLKSAVSIITSTFTSFYIAGRKLFETQKIAEKQTLENATKQNNLEAKNSRQDKIATKKQNKNALRPGEKSNADKTKSDFDVASDEAKQKTAKLDDKIKVDEKKPAKTLMTPSSDEKLTKTRLETEKDSKKDESSTLTAKPTEDKTDNKSSDV